MPNTVLVGAQWGDEGKGKVIDFLTDKSDYVVRFQGGANAGHTVRVGTERFVLHQIPSGIIRNHIICVIGNGVVLDPEALLEEIHDLEARGIRVKGRLKVSDQAHLIMPYHKVLDRLSEGADDTQKIGTTLRGIGPCYTDKASRLGIRVGDLEDVGLFKTRLKHVLVKKNRHIERIYGAKPLSYAKLLNQCLAYRKALLSYTCNTAQLLHHAADQKKRILLEGAQGTCLDIDHGTYPYVTSSNCSAGGAITGTGLGVHQIEEVMGVVKAYTTRVGEGPLPTEFGSALMKLIRNKGDEYGATTGRPRRCGWFDAVVTRHAVRVNGLDHIAVTKLDVLDDLKEIKVCVAYKYRGKTVNEFPAHVEILGRCKPIYRTVRGWQEDTTQIRRYRDLPVRARAYLKFLERLLRTPISIVSVGSHRDQTIVV